MFQTFRTLSEADASVQRGRHPPTSTGVSHRLHANVCRCILDQMLTSTQDTGKTQNLDFSAADRDRSHFFLVKMQMWGIKSACWAELIPATPSACAVITNYRQAPDGRLKPGILLGGVVHLRGEIPIRPTGQTERCRSSIVMCHICRHFQRDINSLPSTPYLCAPVASLCGSYRRPTPWLVS